MKTFLFAGMSILVLSFTALAEPALKDGVGPAILELPLFWDITETPVISIHHNFYQGISLVLAVMPDGKIIWSDDYRQFATPSNFKKMEQSVMGGPFNTACLSDDSITSLILEIEKKEIFQNPGMGPYGSPDGSTYIMINMPQRRLRMISRHESVEILGNRYYNSRGETIPLDDHTTESLLLKEPSDYQRFRNNWDVVKHAIFSLIPQDEEMIEKVSGLTYRIRKYDAVSQTIILPQGKKEQPPPSPKEFLEKRWEAIKPRLEKESLNK